MEGVDRPYLFTQPTPGVHAHDRYREWTPKEWRDGSRKGTRRTTEVEDRLKWRQRRGETRSDGLKFTVEEEKIDPLQFDIWRDTESKD